MSGPDEGMLTAQEKAALASLEARAAADDPGLADHLKGLRSKERLRALSKPDVGWLTTSVAQVWLSLRAAVWGPIFTVVGLVLVVLGIAVSLALSVAGVAVAAVGIGLLTRLANARIEALRDEQARLRASSTSE